MITPSVGLAGWALVVRRKTWRIKWERPNTLCVALQAAALLLVTPLQSQYLGRWLRERTGLAHLDDYLGHLCYLAAACALIYASACRVVDDRRLLQITMLTAVPGVVAAHVMVISLRLSNSVTNEPNDDFFAVPCDTALIVYWLAYACTMAVLMTVSLRLLWALRADPRSRLIADLFIGAALCGFLAGGLRVYAVFTVNPVDMVFTCWLLPCLAALLSAIAATVSWRAKSEAFEKRIEHESLPRATRHVENDETPPRGISRSSQ